MSQNTNFIVGIGGEDLGTVIENFQSKSLKINMTESIAIGNLIPGAPSQGVNSIMIGNSAGITSSQGNFAIAIGDYAGRTTQGGNTVAIGTNAGLSSQGGNAIAIGFNAGSVTQLSDAIAIGRGAGQTSQQPGAIAIGQGAAQTSQGSRSIAIGQNAGTSLSPNSIQINATGTNINQTATSSCIIAPIRSTNRVSANNSLPLLYNTTTNEVFTDISASITITPNNTTNAIQYNAFNALSGAGSNNYNFPTPKITFPATMTISNYRDNSSNLITDAGVWILGNTFASTYVINPRETITFTANGTDWVKTGSNGVAKASVPLSTDYSLPLLQNTTTKEVFTNSRRILNINTLPNTADNSYYNSFILLSVNISGSGTVNIPTPDVPFPATLDILNNDTNAHTITCPGGTSIITNFAGTSNTFVMPANSSLTLKNVDATRWAIIGTGGNQTVNTINAYGAITTGGLMTSAGVDLPTGGIGFGTYPQRTLFTNEGYVAGSFDILQQTTGATSQIRLSTNNTVGIGIKISNTGLLTASGGLTIGGANNITLGSGATAPTAGQLGRTTTGTNNVSTNLTTNFNASTLTIPIAGVYIFAYNIRVQTGSATVINHALQGTGATAAATAAPAILGVANNYSLLQTQVVAATASTYNVFVNFTGTAGQVFSGVFTATRIA